MRQIELIAMIAGLALGLEISQAAASGPDTCSGTCMSVCVPTAPADRAAVQIPDGSLEGVHLGPISGIDGGVGSPVLAVTLTHPYAGDLSLELAYDIDGDGEPEATSPVELYLSRPDPWSAEAWSCTRELNGTYWFRDEGWKQSGADSDFRIFADLPAGGDWYLTVVDAGEGHTGSISDWSVTRVSTVTTMADARR